LDKFAPEENNFEFVAKEVSYVGMDLAIWLELRKQDVKRKSNLTGFKIKQKFGKKHCCSHHRFR
jgi:hypothetical protein